MVFSQWRCSGEWLGQYVVAKWLVWNFVKSVGCVLHEKITDGLLKCKFKKEIQTVSWITDGDKKDWGGKQKKRKARKCEEEIFKQQYKQVRLDVEALRS